MAKTKASSVSSDQAIPRDNHIEHASNVVPLHPGPLHTPSNALHGNGVPLEPGKPAGSPDTAEKIKELLRLAQEQGYLTYSDINESLPDTLATPEEIEQIILQLRNL